MRVSEFQSLEVAADKIQTLVDDQAVYNRITWDEFVVKVEDAVNTAQVEIIAKW